MIDKLDNRRLGRASLVIASGTIVSRVLGLVKMAVLAAVLGVSLSYSADAFTLANALPNAIYALLIGGVISAVMVPSLVKAQLHPDGGASYTNKITTLAIILFAAITIIVTIGAPVLVWIYAGASTGSDVFNLAIVFAYWCLPQVFFYGLYGMLSEVLNSRNRFAPASWIPVLNNVVGIAGLLIFLAIWGPKAGTGPIAVNWDFWQVALLCGSATFGVILQAIVLFFFWKRAGLSFKPDFKWRGIGLKSMSKTAGWAFAILLTTQIANLVQTQVALIPTGVGPSLTAITYGFLLFMVPHSLVTVSINTAVYTKLSAHKVTGAYDELVNDNALSTRVVTFLLIAAAGVIAVLSPAIAKVFTADAIQQEHLTGIIAIYMLGLVPYGIVVVIQRVYYALEQTFIPFVYTLAGSGFYAIAALACIFLPKEILAYFLVLALTVSYLIQLFLALWIMPKYLPGFKRTAIIGPLLEFFILAIPAIAVSAGLVWVLGGYTGGWAVESVIQALVTCVLVGIVFAGVYLGLAKILKLSIIKNLAEFI